MIVLGGGSVMVWAGIHHDGHTALVIVNAQIYWDEILQHHVVPLVNVPGGTLQFDSARPHTAQVCQDFLQQNNIHVLPWAARLAVLSPIEHLDHRVCQRKPLPQTQQELFLTLQN